jgi:hypothetical protein
MYTVNDLINAANRKISPQTMANCRDVYGSINEAARNLLIQIKPKDLSRRAIIENALYDQVNRFECPEDLDQQWVMQWFRLNQRRNTDTFYHPMMQTSNRRFDQFRSCDQNLFTVEYQSGRKFVKVSDIGYLAGQNTGVGNAASNNGGGLVLSDMNAIDNNGLWQVFGNAEALATDNLTYLSGNGSVRMNLNTSGTVGGIFNTTIKPVDISQYFISGKIFTWLDIQDLNQLQSVTLDLFSNPTDLTTNYYSMTVSSPHDTPVFQNGSNLLGFILDSNNGMNVVGTPNPANIAAIRITFVTNGTVAMRNVRLDNIIAKFGVVFGIQYISKFVFETKDGIWKAEANDLQDIVHVQYEVYQLLVEELAIVAGQEVFTDTVMNRKGMIFGKIGQMQNALINKYIKYKKDNKEEFIDEQQIVAKFGVPFGYTNRGEDAGHRFDHNGEL